MAVVSVPVPARPRTRTPRVPTSRMLTSRMLTSRVIISRMVVSRRTRAALGLAVLGWLVVFVAAGLGTSGLPSGSDATVRVSGRTHVVQRGETLWSIATGEGRGGGVDPREAVAELASLNHVDGTDLRVGQVLVLP